MNEVISRADRTAGDRDGGTPLSPLEAAAREAAGRHADLQTTRGGRSLVASLTDVQHTLKTASAFFRTTEVVDFSRTVAAEWLLDNEYIVQQAIRQVREDLPARYYHELPKLTDASGQAGLPRVYDLAQTLIRYEQAQLNLDRLEGFIEAYQQSCPLKLGEIWAIPPMLRLAMLVALCEAVARLTDQEVSATPPAPAPVQAVPDDQWIANTITGLRLLATQDWKRFFERTSLVERTLNEDPAGIYPHMDFESRDHCRKRIERLAAQSGKPEWEVAGFVVRLAEAGLEGAEKNGRFETGIQAPDSLTDPATRTAHVGYFLLDRGQPELEERLGARIPARQRFVRALYVSAGPFYLGSIFLVTAVLVGLLAGWAVLNGGSWRAVLVAAAMSAIPVSAFAVHVVNGLVTRLVPPRVLLKMDFSEAIPASCATVIVIPALLTSEAEIDSLLAQIKLHSLRNPQEHLYYCLLTDFSDAPQREMPGDAALIERAAAGIETLNTEQARGAVRPFFLLHRARSWNAAEGTWMGWERKRGKLHELNQVILGAPASRFAAAIGDVTLLPAIRYVITLDRDSILPRDGARRLIAALAHPLNRAHFDPRTDMVVSGYSILQPRAEIMPGQAGRSLFTRIYSGDTGLDLYTLAVSDVYQDLFGEGIYVGKGIYDVAAFERSLKNRIPENRLLSHDLFEGLFGRTALATDIVILEDYPSNYLAEMQRAHRWIRGDWQLLPWLSTVVPAADGKRVQGTLKPIDRWKMADNLRRSLLPPALLVFLVAGWVALPGPPLFWTAAGILTLSFPTLTGLASGIRQLAAGDSAISAFRSAGQNALRWLFAIVFLPFEAMVHLDAILTTLVRLFFENRRFLQWVTAAEAGSRWGAVVRLDRTWRHMLAVFLLSAILIVSLSLGDRSVLWLAAPILLAWMFSPQIVFLISRPVRRREEMLTAVQKNELRALARLTWLYFEEKISAEDHWLPPDHFQESPGGVVAHRTSPTNIGLGLLSTLAAHDFGYIETIDFAARLHAALDSMEKLDRHRGHFVNWYDTRALAPLNPRYVSTVDSGNLAACLLVLEQGCLDLAARPLFRRESWDGLADLLRAIDGLLGSWQSDTAAGIEPVREYLSGFMQALAAAETRPDRLLHTLDVVSEGSAPGCSIPELGRRLIHLLEEAAGELRAEDLHRLRIYTKRLHLQVDGLKRQTGRLAPWLRRLLEPPALLADPAAPAGLLDGWERLRETLLAANRLEDFRDLPDRAADPAAVLRKALGETGRRGDELSLQWLADLMDDVEQAAGQAGSLLVELHDLADRCGDFFRRMDFEFLFDKRRKLFHLGYNLELERLDGNYYDLLASEACIASLLAIAKGDAPQSHWLHLGRPVTRVGNGIALVSWSATMFEYLMPPLLFRMYAGTLLDQSARAAVDHQIRYGKLRNAPWGISESGYNRFDNLMNYQYRAFGVPGLGYKRGLEEDLVVAPYASFLALPVRPGAVFDNFDRLKSLGMLGTYGLYEAVDFTERRLPSGEAFAIVRSYMAHHQGMILVALANHLNTDRIVERFHSSAAVQSVEHLLQEQVPVDAPLENTQPEYERRSPAAGRSSVVSPWTVPTRTTHPRPHLISNGRYTVLVTNGGGGFSRWMDFDLTRWRADSTLEPWGTWIYVQDADEPEARPWSVTDRPTNVPAEHAEVEYHAHKAVFRRRDRGITLLTEITVPPDDMLEIRRVTATNHSERARRLRLTSYSEVVLAPQASDERHPAFNSLFIESAFQTKWNALFFRRRKRSADEDPVCLAHAVIFEDGGPEVSYESDRRTFLGRGRTVQRPQALLRADAPLSNTAGSVLDPIAALSCTIALRPHETVRLAFLTCTGRSYKALRTVLDRHSEWYTIDRSFDQAHSYADFELRRTGLQGADLPDFGRLLSALVFPQRALRAAADRLSANGRGQSALWRYGISGDDPIVLVPIAEPGDLQLLHLLVGAHSFWRTRRFKVDLVLLNEKGTSYGQELRDKIMRVLTLQKAEDWLLRRGGIFILYADQVDEKDRTLLFTAAGAVLDPSRGSLASQLAALEDRPPELPAFAPGMSRHDPGLFTPEIPPPGELQFDNGLGGASPDGREYVITLKDGGTTPRPWSNVIANESFGFLVTDSGSAFTWAGNSGENRLTPWSNDPVTDRTGEALYLRDEETAELWTPTPLPIRLPQAYRVRHGAGYTVFEHNSHGLHHRLRMYVDPDDPVKIVHLRLENAWDRPRRITATYFAEWVLGVQRSASQRFILPDYDAGNEALLARNPYNEEFAGREAFLAANKAVFGLTADRSEFLGRSGSYERPAALLRVGLTGAVVIGGDPCAALQLHLDLPAGGSEEIYFLLGQGETREHAVGLIRKYKDPAEVDRSWQAVHERWDGLLGAVTVETPDPAMDFLLNRWLLYQDLSCRILGRSAFYQSSGAYGFRDQLQDVMPLAHCAPEIARAHILRAAAHQFEAGDVLHWWHPPSGRGVRTRISDDLAWLPYVTADYIEQTGDLAILDEPVPFREAELLAPGQEEKYGRFDATAAKYPLIEHCLRALQRALTSGPHGLPLIGTGDWNDGMNRVGAEGSGESVWLAWFLNCALERFAGVCERVGSTAQAGVLRDQADGLVRAIEEHAWDGDWYLRAFYDDGSPLGSRDNAECRIDSIAQSWAVISGAGAPDRARRAMESVVEHLVRREDRLVLLFTPPFDRTPHDPGYIRGYLPGIRENGGQYTHAAIWSAWAFARLGEGDLSGEMFDLLNPVCHADEAAQMQRYEVEPYVMAADVYSAPPHTGKGGWTWYTGSGGWMYRLGLEAILGLKKAGDVLIVEPCIPRRWPGFRIRYRSGTATYRIDVRNPDGVSRGVRSVVLDGKELPGRVIPIHQDGRDHEVMITMGEMNQAGFPPA